MTVEVACTCGLRHAITSAEAGAEFACACGRLLVAPPLSAFAKSSICTAGPSPRALEPAQRIRLFHPSLVASTPRLIATPAIVAANVLVVGVMVACGVSFTSPSGDAFPRGVRTMVP